MVDKFGRNYILNVRGNDGSEVTITLPFTIEIDIIRNTYASANTSSLRVYNLAEKTRNILRKDRRDSDTFRDITLMAGYGNKLSIIFKGSVTQCWSIREGSNFITSLECFDGGEAFSNALSSSQFPAGTSYNTMIQSLVRTLPHVTLGKISNFSGVISKGNSYSGSTVEIINQLTGGSLFIDNSEVKILVDDDYVGDDIMEVTSAMGLLGTPLLEESYVVFEILFEPKLQLYQRIRLNSDTNKNYNSDYKVVGIKHRAIISEVICGEATTTIEVSSKPRGEI